MGLPKKFPSPGDLPNPVIEPASPELAGGLFTTEPPGKPLDSMEDPYFFKKKLPLLMLMKFILWRKLIALCQNYCLLHINRLTQGKKKSKKEIFWAG